MSKLSDSVERKFIESYATDEYEVWTDTGWEDITHSNKTVEYEEYVVRLENGIEIIVADTHIFFDGNLNEVFAKDCLDIELFTEFGPSRVVSVEKNGNASNMFDLSVGSDNQRYFTNGILSHNSITAVAWLLWYVLFNADKSIAILANKGSLAREMLARLTLMLENIPFFLQPGCRTLNKGSIVFSNNARAIAAATSSSSIRGESFNIVFLDELAFVQNANEFYTSTYPVITSGKDTKVIITSTPKGVGNLFHKIWEGAVTGVSNFKPYRIYWHDIPGRDEKWKEETIANTSEIQFAQEFECLGGDSEVCVLIDNKERIIKLKDLHETYPL